MISISPPVRVTETSSQDDIPLLSLTHFSRPPFVTFGCVQPGSSRSAVLMLHNPSPDPVQVTVHKLPSHRGFTVPESDIFVPADDSVPLTITWTPLEEGAVRELVTFVVNDVVKHQAVLLGRAELPSKKRRARWNTIKKKHSPIGPKLSVLKNKEISSTAVKNKTFNLKSKNGRGVPDVAKNPLQACENVSKPVIRETRVRKGRRSSENKAPSLHASPLGGDLQDFLPGSLKRSKTYSVLCTTEYETIEEVTATSTIHRDRLVEEQWTVTEHTVNKLSISPINPVRGHPHNYTCTPSVMNDFKTLSPNEFYNVELAIRHVDHVSEKSSSYQESFHECLTKMSSMTPPPVLLTPQRKVLSPDSFVNNSYVSDEYLDATNHTPVLSPDQFVKENFLTPPVVEKCTTSQFRSESVDEVFSVRTFERPALPISRLTFCVKKPKPPLHVTGGSSVAKNAEKPPINTATVIKTRSSDSGESKHRPPLKSRRRLRGVEAENEESNVPERLPVVGSPDTLAVRLSSPAVCSGPPLTRDNTKSIVGHKRRSVEISAESSGASSESLCVTQAKRSHVPASAGSQHVRLQDHGQGTQMASSTPNVWKIQKSKLEVRGKPTVTKSRQKVLEKTPMPQLHSAVTFKHSKKVVAVPQAKLTFMKSAKTVIPRHPMPFADKNMFYDERWMAKQERGFTWWLNFILTPDDFAVKTDSMKVNAAALILGAESSHKVSVPKAPTKEEVSLKAYTARCRLNRLRRSACRLFTSDPVVKAIRRLEIEIEARRLLVRKDRHLWKDVGERQKILGWLLSYNPLWLRVGLETIFGELVSLEGNSDVTGLAVFILNRLLWNPDIAAEYRHPSVPHLYRDGHEEALSKFTLKKLLLLVFFLDYAKRSRLIDHDPCLFCKDAEFKTSKDLLLAFSRDFLSGEGDLSRHLGYLGLPVSHAQTPLDEFDFAVSNLAVDLQCGVRLVRTMELLTHNWSLSKKLRVPAISRLQKMHNVEVALQVLADRGVQIKDERGNIITSKDIVDRHRERTLALLWTLVFTFQVEVMLNVEHLKEEIKFLKHSYSTQKRLAALRSLSFPTATKKRDSNPFTPDNYNERVLLLMEWVNAVCAFYNAKVENFTVSFSDARVFCYLINHYHPSYVALDSVSQRTTQTIECNETGTVGLNSSSDSENSLDMWSGMCEQGFTTSALYKELLDNERSNFSLLQTAVSNLGGIPAMIHHSDMSNTIPDEKIVITFLSFLCARLLDIRKEARAARVIQAAWRKYKVTAEEQLLQKKHKAASTIQIAVRKFLSRRWILKRTTSAVVIQKHWRRYLAYKELRRLKLHKQKEIETSAAIVIQRTWRCFAARKHFMNVKKCVVLLQANLRTKMAVSAYRKTMHAAITLQRHVRAWFLTKKDRADYLQMKSAALAIQSAFRRWRRVKHERETAAAFVLQKAYRKWRNHKLERKRKAATVIQSFYRMSRERCRYCSVRAAAVKLQSLLRMRRARIRYLTLREKVIFVQTRFRSNMLMRRERLSFLHVRAACVTIQSAMKGHLVRKQIKLCHKAATTLQANFRMMITRRKYLTAHRAAVFIQQRYRAYKLAAHHRERYLRMKSSAVCIQAAYRGYTVRKSICTQHVAAVFIQTTYRSFVARKRYVQMRRSAISIQRWYRGQKKLKEDMECFSKTKSAVVTIQAAYRGLIVRRQLHQQTMAAITIQSTYRRFTAERRFREMKAAALTIQRVYRAVLMGRTELQRYLHTRVLITRMQAMWRAKRVMREIETQHEMATRIQSYYRMHVCYTRYRTMKQSALRIQSHYRAYIAGKVQRAQYLNLKAAATLIQAAYRGRQVRKHLLQLHHAACKIQASYRSFTLRKEYLRMKMAAVCIQRQYRAVAAAKLQRERYRLLRQSTIKLQSTYRGIRTRRRIIQMQSAAVLLQSVFKMQKQRKRYRRMKNAAILIQKKFRTMKEVRTQRQQYLSLKKAACTLQSVWRGKKARREIRRMHAAATLIQSWYRMVKKRQVFRNLKKVAITIQQHYRAKKQMLIFNNTRKAAVCIQSAFRAVRLRRQFRAKREAAVVLQRAFKSRLMRRRFLTLQSATVCVQKRFRWKKLADRQRQEYLRSRSAARVIQAAFRGFQDRQKLRQMHSSATVIQAAFRMHKHRVAYQKLKQSAVTIQQYYRACRVSAQDRKTFLNLKKSAVIIQSAYRGTRVRQRVDQMNKAAMKIQATFRMYQCRTRYKRFLWAARALQQRYRAKNQRDFDMLRYSFIKDATVVIQSAYRGTRVRQRIGQMNKAAITIQSTFRMYQCRTRYKRFLWAVCVLQQRYRVKNQRDFDMLRYSFIKDATVLIQAAYRGWCVRKELRTMGRAATVIQRLFRTYLERRRYLTLRSSALLIQRRYRAAVWMHRCHSQYKSLRKAAVCIQASYRGFKVRKELALKHAMATRIQSAFRTYLEQKRYLTLRSSVLLIQRRYRATVLTHRCHSQYKSLRKAAICIQASYRGFKVRKDLALRHAMATRIQSAFRTYLEWRRYLTLQSSSLLIQRRYRATVLMHRCHSQYKSLRKAAVCIQASYRGFKVRKDLTLRHAMATRIQSAFRTYLERRQYLTLRSSALLIQRRYRATVLTHRCHSQYKSLRKAAVCIQASYRGFKVRKDLALRHAMATRIQSAFRAYKTLALYKSERNAARRIQTWYRSIVEMRGARASFLKLRRAALVIQAGYRGMKLRDDLKVQVRAATVIQANYRMYVQKKYYRSLIKATQTVQQRYRARRAAERDFSWYQTAKRSAIRIQAAFRGMNVRRSLQTTHLAATTIQRFVKGYLIRREYVNLRSASLRLQRRYRASVAARAQRLRFLTCRKAAVCIQSGYRGFKARQRLQKTYQAHSVFTMYNLRTYAGHKNSTALQKNYFIYQTYVLRERECYLNIQHAAVVLQASYRGMKSRRNVRKMHDAATVIQTYYRMHRQRRSYRTLQRAARTLQLYFRATILRNEAVKRYNDLKEAILGEVRAAVVIQTTWKMFRDRRAFMKAKTAAVRLQASIRGYQARKRHRMMAESAHRIQSWYRRCHQVRIQRARYLSIQTSAVVVQSAIRGLAARRLFKQEKAARVLQSYYRMTVCRRKFLQLKASAVTLQTCYRMQKVMQTYKKQSAAAVVIQRWYRSVVIMRRQRAAFMATRRQIVCVQAAVRRFNAQRAFGRIRHAALMAQIAKKNTELRLLRFSSAVHHHLCAVKIQRWFRRRLILQRAQKQVHRVISIQRWYRSRLQRRTFLSTRQKVICVQRAARVWLHRRHQAANTIQRYARSFLLHKRRHKVISGIIRFQALWRAHRVRRVNDTKNLRNIRTRLRKASEEIKAEDKLCNRTLVALNYLLTYKHFSYILAALKHLEAATRLSSVCCEKMARSGAVEVIITLIRSCNRSIPCMEVIRLSTQVLLNLTKYEKTVSAVYEVKDSVDVLLDLMQIYREKPGDKVPEKGGSIFTKTCCLLAIFGQDSTRAQEIRDTPKAMSRISSIYALMSRKHRMDAARSVRKQLMSSSRGPANTSLHATPLHTRIVSRIKPDWVLRKDNMREVVDPLQAAQLVMATFALPSR